MGLQELILPGADGIWKDPVRCREFDEMDRSKAFDAIREILEGVEFKTVLELGCGSGRICELLEWEEYWAVDQSEAMLDLLRERLGDRKALHVRQAWIQDYEQEEPVDLVVCYGVFQHAIEPKALFEQVMAFDFQYLLANFLEWAGVERRELSLPNETDACSWVLPRWEVDEIIGKAKMVRRIDLRSEHVNYWYRVLLLEKGDEG